MVKLGIGCLQHVTQMNLQEMFVYGMMVRDHLGNLGLEILNYTIFEVLYSLRYNSM